MTLHSTSDMSDIAHGACLCEGVKFAVSGQPDNVFICYCMHCSKNAGAPAQIVSAPSDQRANGSRPSFPRKASKCPRGPTSCRLGS